MKTYKTRRKKGFRCLFALVTVTILAVPYLALGAGQSFSEVRAASRLLGCTGNLPFHILFTALDFLVGMDSMIRTSPLFSRFNLHQAPNRNPPKTASTFRHTGWMVVTECRSYSQVTGSFQSKRQSIDPLIPS